VQNYIDNALIAEAVYKTSGISAEIAGGVFLNLVPKDGSNTIHGQGFFAVRPTAGICSRRTSTPSS
jgi:hypothetical protein